MNPGISRPRSSFIALLLPLLLLSGCRGTPQSAEDAFENLRIHVLALQGREIDLEESRLDLPEEGVSVILDNLYLIGDLDGSGRRHASGIIYTEREGMPTTSELLVAVEAVGDLRYLASHPLGEGYRLEGIRYAGGEVVLNLLEPAPDDPPCCPSQSVERRFHLMGGGLMESGPAMMGPAQAPASAPAAEGGTP